MNPALIFFQNILVHNHIALYKYIFKTFPEVNSAQMSSFKICPLV